MNRNQLFIYKVGHPNQQFQVQHQQPLRAQPNSRPLFGSSINPQQQANYSPNSFMASEIQKMKNKVRPKAQDDRATALSQVQQAAQYNVEAHQIQRELAGMQSLPMKSVKTTQQDLKIQTIIDDTLPSKPKFQSARADNRPSGEDVDWDALRTKSLKGRRSTRRLAEPVVTAEFSDMDIPDESISYIFKAESQFK